MNGAERNVGRVSARTAAVVLLALVVAFSASCKRKKKTSPPPAATAPTISQPTNTPPPPPPVTVTPPSTTPAPSTTTTTTTTPAKPKPKKRTLHKPAPKPAQTPPAQQQATTPAKPSGAVGSNTSTDPSMTISPNINPNDVTSQKQQTENLLQAAEANLRKINRTLSDGEQGMVRQVRNYITQSRLATQDGDLERARNLAVKAQLLSAELTK